MKKLLLTAAAFTLTILASPGAIEISAPGDYTQNFDALPKAPNNGVATGAWTDNSTLPGWYLFRPGSTTAPLGFFGTGELYVYDGIFGTTATLNPTGHFYSYGASGSSDRALGAVPISAWGECSQIAVFQNTSGAALRIISINFNGEVYRTNQNANVVESIFLSWKKDASLPTLLAAPQPTATATAAIFPAAVATGPGQLYVTGWNALSNGTFTYTGGPGNTSVAVSTPMAVAPLSEIRINPGEYIALRWANINDSGADAMIGIDDVKVTFGSVDVSITGVVSNVVRNDNGTPRNPADDTVTFDLTVSGTGLTGAGWQITAPPALAGQSGSFAAAVPLTLPIAEFTGAGQSVNLTLVEAGNPTNSAAVAVLAPRCTLNIPPATNFAYDSKGTPALTDDEVSYIITVDGQYTGATYSLTVNGTAAPEAYAYGAPLALIGPPPGTFDTIIVTDSSDVNCKTSIEVFPPGIIGTQTLTGTAIALFSEPVATAGGQRWTINPATPSVVQSGNPANVDHVLLSRPLDLSAADKVEFTARLSAAAPASSGFEAADSFALELIIDGVPVSVLGAADSRPAGAPDGRLRGGDEEFPSTIGTTTFNFSYEIPAEANSVQVRITGNSNSANEIYTVSGINFAPVRPKITLSAATAIQRNLNQPGPADDTVSFDVTITGQNGGTGWTAAGTTPAAGAFGTVTLTVPAGASSVTLRFADNAFPDTFQDLTVALPGPYFMGSVNSGAGAPANFFTAETPVPDPQWVVSGTPPQFRMNGLGLVAPFKTVESETVTLPAGVTAWQFSGNLHVLDTSSGFEATDEFNAWLIINGNTAAPLSLISTHDLDASGTMAGAELCPAPAVNPTTQNFDYALTAVLPAGTTTVQVVITGLCNSTNETMTVSNLVFSPFTGVSDSDGDGVSDADEAIMGTLPNDASSVLRLSAAPGGFSFPTVAGRFYRIYASSTAAGAASSHLQSWIDTGTTITGDGATATVPVTPEAGVPRRFYRLHVKRNDTGWPAQVP